MRARRKLFLAALLASVMSLGGPGLAAETKPEGEMRFALYVTVAPAWLDPGEAIPDNLTPFWIMLIRFCRTRDARESKSEWTRRGNDHQKTFSGGCGWRD